MRDPRKSLLALIAKPGLRKVVVLVQITDEIASEITDEIAIEIALEITGEIASEVAILISGQVAVQITHEGIRTNRTRCERGELGSGLLAIRVRDARIAVNRGFRRFSRGLQEIGSQPSPELITRLNQRR